MKKTISLMMILLVIPVALAQSQSQAGITPDHPLYFLDELFDNIRYNLARGQRKAEVGLEIAEERVGEMKIMAENNIQKGLERAKNNYNRMVNQVQEKADEQTQERIQERLQKHVETLEQVMEKTPEQAKQGLQTAIENSQRVIKSNLGGKNG